MRKAVIFILVLFCMAFAMPDSYGKDPVRILAIGNSFSEDAVEQNLWQLFEAGGEKAIIGNMYIGGCSLERHAKNIREDIADYAYRKIGLDGIKRETRNFTLRQAIKDEKWDYVSIQQASGFSGIYDSYHPYVDELIEFIRENVPSSCKIVFHQTWAYQQGSSHRDFTKYGRDQMRMYEQIVSSCRKVLSETGIKTVIPSGTAIQNARTSSIGDNMTRDGYHLELLYGRFAAACTWYETISGHSAKDNPYAPAHMSKDQVRIIKKAAHKAVSKPWTISVIR